MQKVRIASGNIEHQCMLVTSQLRNTRAECFIVQKWDSLAPDCQEEARQLCQL